MVQGVELYYQYLIDGIYLMTGFREFYGGIEPPIQVTSRDSPIKI